MAWSLGRGKGSLIGLGASRLHLAYLLGDRDGALGHAKMQSLHHAAFHDDDALLLALGPAEGIDDLARPLDFLARRREDFVARRDLARVDQRLAVHAERAAPLAFLAQAKLVLEVVIDAVDDVEAIGARG